MMDVVCFLATVEDGNNNVSSNHEFWFDNARKPMTNQKRQTTGKVLVSLTKIDQSDLANNHQNISQRPLYCEVAKQKIPSLYLRNL